MREQRTLDRVTVEGGSARVAQSVERAVSREHLEGAVKHQISHDLTPEQLEKAVRRFAEVYCERFREYHAEAHWRDPRTLEVSFNVSGAALRGSLFLGPRALEIDMKVPLAFRLFKGRAVRAIEEEVQPWLAAARRGELP